MTKRPPKYDECLFHSPCADGVAAAYVVSHFTNTSKMTPCLAGRDPVYIEFPKDQSILYVDLSPSGDHLDKLLENGNKVTIIDHHESATRALERFRGRKNVILVIDMRRSGCGLTWDFFSSLVMEDLDYPWLLKYIEDRDLWQFKLENTKYVTCSLFYYYPNLFVTDIQKILKLYPKNVPEEWVVTGKRILEEREKEVAIYVGRAIKCEHISNFVAYVVMCVNCPPHFRSDVGNELAKMADFAAIWEYDHTKDEWWISLRASDNCKTNMVDIAKEHGGGGHPKASGFTIYGNSKSINQLKDVFVPISKEYVPKS